MRRSSRLRTHEPGDAGSRAIAPRRDSSQGLTFWSGARPALTLGAAGSVHEQQAEHAAREVMSPSPPRTAAALVASLRPIELPPILPPPGAQTVHRSPASPSGASASTPVAPQVEAGIASRRGQGSPLPSGLRAFMEPRLGAGLGGVRVHADSASDRLARSLQARAFTTGQDVFFKQGEYSPDSKAGRTLLAHELTHALWHGGSTVHRAIDHDAPVVNQDNGRAGSVEVENIRGTSLGAGANQPAVSPYGWQALWQAGHTLGNVGGASPNTHYNAVRMHLWNGRLEGPGNQTWNLAPGPAQVNSSMSAGPETAAKDAVDNGRTIWLHTWVTYQNNDTSNPADFTSVVPNTMTMEWGYMLDAQGRQLTVLGATGTQRGPARGPAWQVNIDQPAGAMSAQRQLQYQGVASTAALDVLLAAASTQEKAQAFSIIPAQYKPHLLVNHPGVYLQMEDNGRQAALALLSAAQVEDLLTALAFTTTAAVVDEVLRLLYPTPVALEAVFNRFGNADKLRYATFRDGEMLPHLGASGEALAKVNRPIFSLYSPARQYALLDAMSAGEINTLLGGRADVELLDAWARSHGNADLDAMEAFVQGRIPAPLFARYQGGHRFERQRLADEARRAQDPRPRRASTQKASKKFKPY